MMKSSYVGSERGRRNSLLGNALVGGLVAFGVLAGSTANVQAQTPAQQFAEADWFERELGDGVVWRNYMFENLYGGRQHISYIEIDLDNPAVEIIVPHLPNGNQRTTQMTPNQFPDALASVNGTYYASGGHNTYLRVDGTVIPHQARTKGLWGHHAGFILDDQGEWGIDYIPGSGVDDWALDTTSETIMANGPMLLLGGDIQSSAIALPSGTHCTGRRSRTVVGLTNDNRAILMTVDEGSQRSTGVTCEEMAELLLLLDVVDAVNLDGGGSTTMWVGGEINNGLANYLPSGAAERAVSNALGVTSSAPAAPVAWDARLTGISYNSIMQPEDTQTITVTYENIGTETWTAADTQFVTARPEERASDLYDSITWISDSQPVAMSPATVAPGQTATFAFQVTAPDSAIPVIFEEFFMLTQEGVGRIGPNDSRVMINLNVIPETPTGPTFYVEARASGQNHAWYSDGPSGWGDSNTGADTTPGLTASGSRTTSTFSSVIGVRTAQWRPNFAEAGTYAVAVSWPDSGTLRRNPVRYTVHHANGTTAVDLDQTAPGYTWYPLGVFEFNEGASDSGRVVVTNEFTDVSGNLWASGTRWVLIEDEGDTSVEDWMLID